jgi:hypothetical protein
LGIDPLFQIHHASILVGAASNSHTLSKPTR